MNIGLEETHMLYFLIADERKIGCDGEEKIENHFSLENRRHTFLAARKPNKCGFDGRTSVASGYIY